MSFIDTIINILKSLFSKETEVVEREYDECPTPVSTTIVTTSTPTKDRDGRIIGDVEFDYISIGDDVLAGVVSKTYEGKDFYVHVKPVTEGNVVLGIFFDDEMVGEGDFNVISDTDCDIVKGRFPQYDTKFTIGDHKLEVKIGYVSGYDNGDQVTFIKTIKSMEVYVYE